MKYCCGVFALAAARCELRNLSAPTPTEKSALQSCNRKSILLKCAGVVKLRYKCRRCYCTPRQDKACLASCTSRNSSPDRPPSSHSCRILPIDGQPCTHPSLHPLRLDSFHGSQLWTSLFCPRGLKVLHYSIFGQFLVEVD